MTSSFSPSFMCFFLRVCGVLEEREGGGRVYVQNALVCRFKTSPCMPAPRPHVVTHVCVVPVRTGTFWIYTRGLSACHGTHHDHTTATATHTHTRQRQRQRQRHTTNQTITSTNQPATQFDSTRENSPGLDTARIDRLIALSSFSVWWCRAVLSWWSALSC